MKNALKKRLVKIRNTEAKVCTLPQWKIIVKKDKIDEENASDEVDRNGKQSSTVGSCLSGNLVRKLMTHEIFLFPVLTCCLRTEFA